MTLALTLGMSIGYRRTLWMMAGELVGVALVSVSAVLGIAAIMLNYPWLFTALKLIGGGYLLYLGIEMSRVVTRLSVRVVRRCANPLAAGHVMIRLLPR